MLHFTMTGEGQNVLFLHGFLESSTMWRYLSLRRLPFQSILIDLPGHGASDLGDALHPPTLQHFADLIIDLVDLLKLDDYSVVGHSMGGYVALLLKEQDLRCKKVVLLNSNFWSDDENKKKDRIRLADLAFSAREHLIREAIPGLFWNLDVGDAPVKDLVREASKIPSECIAYASLAMKERSDRTELLKAFPDDVFLLHGEKDPLIQTDVLDRKCFGLSVHVEVLTGAGHMAHIETPELVISHLKEFLF